MQSIICVDSATMILFIIYLLSHVGIVFYLMDRYPVEQAMV